MAFEPGGYADKLGNRFEGRWVVRQLLRLSFEDIRSVAVECIGDDERGVDLWVERKDGVRQAQQCKARNTGREHWSLSDLRTRGILAYLKLQLDREPNHEFALVSGIPASQIADICQSARDSNGQAGDFYRCQIEAISEKRRVAFREFCQALELDCGDPSDRERAVDYLRRTHFHRFLDDQSTRDELQTWAGMLFTGRPDAVIAALADYAQDQLRKPIFADALRKHMGDLGFHPKQLAHDMRLAPAINERQREFVEWLQPKLIRGELIPREETRQVCEALKTDCVVVVHGTAGTGKSGVLFELQQELGREAILCLAVSLDQWHPKNTTREFGNDLGLPDSPVLCLDSLAQDRPSVLILDQLDSLRWTAAHSHNAMAVCRAFVREIQSLRSRGRRVGIVFSCRTFDLEHDPELSHWLGNRSQEPYHKIEVKGLSDEAVERLVGSPYACMSRQQKNVLASPHNLAMWVQIAPQGNAPTFQSATGLMRAFWSDRRARALSMQGVSDSELTSTLNALVHHLVKTRKRTAPERLLADHRRVTEALHSLGVIYTSSHRVAFTHQSYLDFLVADCQLRQNYQGRAICDWLGQRRDQSLFVREQLRYVLSLICDESPDDFVREIRGILASPSVRFHLKHLVLEILSQIEEPSSALLDYLLALLGDESMKPHILEAVLCGRTQFVLPLIDRGVIQAWLDSSRAEFIDAALWLLRSVNEKCGDSVAALLEPHITRGEEWCERILRTLPIGTSGDSERSFALRLQLARKGHADGLVDWAKLAGEFPRRAIELIEAVLSTYGADANNETARTPSNQQSRLINWLTDDIGKLAEAARQHAIYVWDMLMPHVKRLTTVSLDEGRHLWLDWEDTQSAALRSPTRDILVGVIQMVQAAGRALAEHLPAELLQRTQSLESNPSHVIQQLLVDIYASLPPSHSDAAIRWLLADNRRLRVGLGRHESPWNPAARLIHALSSGCSIAVFHELEQAILGYHSPREKEEAACCLLKSRRGRFGNWFGEAQYFLLPALCPKRRSLEAEGMIGVMERKFGPSYKPALMRARDSNGGLITSPLKPEKLLRISDKAWLGIVQNKSVFTDRHSAPWRQVGPDHATESSVEEFSRSLAEAAKRAPERFARLALKFPKDAPSAYAAAVLRGILMAAPSSVPEEERASWAPARHETIEAMFDAQGLADDLETAQNFCSLIRDRASELWSAGAIRKLLHYAKEHPDPAAGELNVGDGSRGNGCVGASTELLMQNTLNCVRSAAGLAIGRLLWEHPDWLERLRPGIEALINDPHPVPRMAAVTACVPVLRIDKNLAVSWFCNACEGDLRVAACDWAVEIFNSAIQSHEKQLSPIILAMCQSEDADVAQEGAEEVTARWLFFGMFEEHLAACKCGSAATRRGVVHIAAAFLTKDIYTDRCRDLLLEFLDDSDATVRSEAARVFAKKDVLRLPAMATFVKRFVNSAAFAEAPRWLLLGLHDHTDRLIPYADSLLAICEVLSGPLVEHTRGFATALGHDVRHVPPLLLRLYEQAQDEEMPSVQNKCLDAWDILFEHRVGMIRDLTKALDR